MDVSRNERAVVDEAIERILGDDHARLADVMFELVKNEDHYRVLAKHCTKQDFLLRYLERLCATATLAAVPGRQVVYDDSDDEAAPANVAEVVPAVRQIVYDDSDEEGPLAAGNDEVVPAVRQIVYDDSDEEGPLAAGNDNVPYDDSDEEGPLGADNDEVVIGSHTGVASLRETALNMPVESRGAESDVLLPVVESTKQEPVAVELIDAADPSRMVELRPRGVSAVPEEEVGKLAEGDEWVPLKTRGNSMLQEPEGLEVEQFETSDQQKDVPLVKVEAPEMPARGDDTHVVQELKELPTKFEMVDLVPAVPEAVEEELDEKAPPVSNSLFNPPARPILFGKAPPTSKPSATTDSLQQRLLKKKEAEARNQERDVNPDDEAEKFILAGSISKEGTTPWMDPRKQKNTVPSDSKISDSPYIPEMHSGPAGTYDRDTGGKWNRKGSDLSVS